MAPLSLAAPIPVASASASKPSIGAGMSAAFPLRRRCAHTPGLLVLGHRHQALGLHVHQTALPARTSTAPPTGSCTGSAAPGRAFHVQRLVRKPATWNASPVWQGCSVVGLLALCIGCGSGALSPAPATASGAETGCEVGAPLKGATYDLTKSRFAFGSTPIRDDSNGISRWVGVDGVVAIWSTGGELGSMNGGAPEASLPDWSNDPTALGAHVTEYFASFGVSACQVGDTSVLGGSGGRSISLVRTIDGIIVAESLAYARFDDQDQSTSEGFYWPPIPADVIASARAFHARLADPNQLAAYKAKLPANAQGDGVVNLHHTNSSSRSPFAAAATYDVETTGGQLGLPTILSFDTDGSSVSMVW
jgi:hypothetical protein